MRAFVSLWGGSQRRRGNDLKDLNDEEGGGFFLGARPLGRFGPLCRFRRFSLRALLEMAARIHHRLAWIHPFPNGNGRLSRFVSNLFLFSHRCPLPVWPTELNRESTSRASYIAALQVADKGDFQPLIEYITRLGAQDRVQPNRGL